jgi:hypothetical protein
MQTPRVIATGVRVDEYPDPEQALAAGRHVVSRPLSPEERANLAAWRSGTLLFVRTTAFVEFDVGEGTDRWDDTPQGPFSVDLNRPATSRVLECVEHNDDLLAEFGINGMSVSRIDFYAAPRRIEIDQALSDRLIWD